MPDLRPIFLLLLSAITAMAITRDELTTATLVGVPAEQHAAIRFLIGNMPAGDINRLTPEFLRTNTALAFQARAEFPWGKDIPDDIFFNDVLPYASIDEARDPWRADFLDRFRKHVAGALSAREAILKLNAAIAAETGVAYSRNRRAPNQGPGESIKTKAASCTGLSILLVDALRAVGLPARIVGTALWTTKFGNHNWVEVWLPETKTWTFTEFYPDARGFDHGWLLGEAARAIPGSAIHGIYATSWRKTGTHFPLIWDLRDTSIPGIEVTQRYLDMGKHLITKDGECELQIDVLNAAGQRESLTVEVRQADVRVATGESPKPIDDMNRFLTAKVKQGRIYQIIAFRGGQAVAIARIQTDAKQTSQRVTLKLKG